jgi:serine/threonine-protein kinase RsbW
MNLKNQLTIDSRLEEAAQACDWLADLASQAGFTPTIIGDLKLVLTEAIGNVVYYSYDGEPGHPITLSLSMDEEALTLTIRDFGHPPDVSRYHTPDLSELREGNYDAFLIHSLMDEVRYDASPETGATLTLVKYR